MNTNQDQEREAFETWARTQPYLSPYIGMRHPEFDTYTNKEVSIAYSGYCAALCARPSREVAESRIREVAEKYSRFVPAGPGAPKGHYVLNEFDCWEDLVGFVREICRCDAPVQIKFQTADEYLSERNGAASKDWINGFTACRNAAIKASQAAPVLPASEPTMGAAMRRALDTGETVKVQPRMTAEWCERHLQSDPDVDTDAGLGIDAALPADKGAEEPSVGRTAMDGDRVIEVMFDRPAWIAINQRPPYNRDSLTFDLNKAHIFEWTEARDTVDRIKCGYPEWSCKFVRLTEDYKARHAASANLVDLNRIEYHAASPQGAALPSRDEREAFEARFGSREGGDHLRDAEGDYSYAVIQLKWEGWQAALQSRQPSSATASHVAWQPMETAPKDGTLVRLLVQFDDNATEDSAEPCPTIGANSGDDTGEDRWEFAGWNWSHDCFTNGVGTPVGWLPMLSAAPAGDIGEAPAKCCGSVDVVCVCAGSDDDCPGTQAPPCEQFVAGATDRCAWCDHEAKCHVAGDIGERSAAIPERWRNFVVECSGFAGTINGRWLAAKAQGLLDASPTAPQPQGTR